MFFSDKFKVSEQSLNDYGALNIWMERDTPLYIDPILIYCNKKYEAWHKKIIKYFNFLYEKTQNPNITKDQLKTFFNFHEIKNNWLGVSRNSNNGRGFGEKLTELLWNNLSFIFEKNDITKDFHIEKSLLLTDKSGKDLISDLITNIIIDDLLEFTETFAKKYIDKEKCCIFKIRSKFDYQIETWIDHEYFLPYITTNCEKKEWVLLTPIDILRNGEPSICKEKLYKSYDRFGEFITNEQHRSQFNSYITQCLEKYKNSHKNDKKSITKQQIKKARKKIIIDSISKFSWIYDYFVLANEKDYFCEQKNSEIERYDIKKEINSCEELFKQIKKHINLHDYDNESSAEKAAKRLLENFKCWIEKQDGYKVFWNDNERVCKTEDHLNITFRLLSGSTCYDLNSEVNNGRGPADFIISRGGNDKCVIEFKLAKNKKIKNIFKQVDLYAKAANTDKKLFCIFIFDKNDQNKINELMKSDDNFKLNTDRIVVIDCRKDNKPSGSMTQ